LTPLYLDNKIETIFQKYAHIVEAVTEFHTNTECQSCSKKLKDVLQKYSILKGPSTDPNRLTAVLPDNKKKVSDLNVDVVSKNKWLSEIDPSDNQMHEERSHDISIKR
jgi:hypothetical protein